MPVLRSNRTFTAATSALVHQLSTCDPGPRMKRLSIGAASLLSVASLLPTPAAAADTLGVVVVAESAPPPELVEITQQLRAAVAERAQGVLEPSQLRARMTGPSSQATLPEIERAYAGALASYQNGDFEGSVRSLRAIVDDLDKLPESAEVFKMWTRVMLRLGRSEGTLGHKAEARAALERLLRAAPNTKVDRNEYPPSFDKQVSEILAEIRSLPFRRLTVLGPAKGTRVFLEGRDLGMAPVSVEVPSGRYRVSGTYGGVRVPPTTVDLSQESQVITLAFEVAQALRPGFGPGLQLPEHDRPAKVVTAGAFLGLDRLLAASIVEDGGAEYLSGTLYDVRHGTLLREGRVRLMTRAAPGGSLEALAAFLITGQASNLVAAIAETAAPVSPAAQTGPTSPGGRAEGPGRARFNAARDLLRRGDFKKAGSEFSAIAADAAADPALQESARILSEESKELARRGRTGARDFSDSSGRGEFVYFMSGFTTYEFIGIAALADVSDPKAYLALTIAGLGTGIGVGILSTRGRSMPSGRAAAIDSATIWASVNAATISGIVGTSFDTGFGATLATGALALGTSWGLTGRRSPSVGDVTIVNSAGYWGLVATTLGLVTFATEDLTGKQVSWTILGGLDAGLVAGVLLARRSDISRGRMLIIDAGGLLGALVGVAIPVFAGSDNSRFYGGATLGGIAAGLAATTYFTRHWDDDTKTSSAAGLDIGPALLPLSDGRLAAGFAGRF